MVVMFLLACDPGRKDSIKEVLSYPLTLDNLVWLKRVIMPISTKGIG